LNVLSQQEIDELMRSLTSGEDSNDSWGKKEAYKKYDFRTANRFTKDHIRTIGGVYKTFDHLLSNYMVGLLRTSCEVEVLSHEEMSFMEYFNSVPSPSVISVVKVAPTGGTLLLDISKDLVFSIVSRVLGGTESVQSDNRQFTDIELMIMERIIWQILACYDEAWGKIITLSTRLERTETGMQFAQIVDNNEAVFVVTLNIQLGAEQSVISFCLPRQTMAPIFKKLNMQDTITVATEKGGEAYRDELREVLGHADVEVSARFNPTIATTEDVLRLQVGDVIKLDHELNKPITVMLQNRPKFKASYGSLRNRYAVKIQEIIGEETT